MHERSERPLMNRARARQRHFGCAQRVSGEIGVIGLMRPGSHSRRTFLCGIATRRGVIARPRGREALRAREPAGRGEASRRRCGERPGRASVGVGARQWWGQAGSSRQARGACAMLALGCAALRGDAAARRGSVAATPRDIASAGIGRPPRRSARLAAVAPLRRPARGSCCLFWGLAGPRRWCQPCRLD